MGERKLAPTFQEPSLWKNKHFMFLWIGKVISNFGFQIYVIALPLLIYELSKSALAMSMMRAVDFLPNIFIGMLAGVMVDRFNRKRIMKYAVIMQIIALSAVVLLIFSNEIAVWHLYIFGFILSTSGYAFGNSQHSSIPQLVSKEQLTAANAKLTFVDTFVSMIGPGVAGIIIAFYSFGISFSFYLICLVVLLVLILFIQVPPVQRKQEKQTSVWEDMKEGIQELFGNKTLLTPTVITIFSNLSASLVVGVLIFYAADILNASEKEIGFMFSFGAVGGLIGTLVITRLRKKMGRGRIYAWCLLIEIISLMVLIFANTWWLIGLSLLIRSFSVIMSNVVYFTIRQEFTPNHLLGRVSGTSSMLMKLALPLGLFIAGLWAEFLPIPLLFIFSTLIMTVLYIVIKRSAFFLVE
ncbi:MFS transporter [Sutcliffiella rhizosphaerae]|uniref:Enterobactin exporter EntS n=1 Tax=Sutcliffiella rhizosphaerae TaxID=2880967 RepID=A0ABN8A8Z6_9BACI|nr:MFS transporter [Sutcliffiella rhizosphaerae]CAG9620402.1 Enterobactin exporter EntS [Sutcliffiella rhizosphaerae]